MTPEVSADGRFVAFRAIGALVCGPADRCANRRKSSSQSAHIHVHDTVKDVTTRVTGADGSEPNGPSSWPAISADGRYVAFTSEASNLVENDNNRQADVFLHDRDTGITELVSRRPDGRSGNGPSRFPAISGDGQTVAFQSIASDLICAKRCAEHERDINLVSDVFVLDRKSGTMTRASADGTSEWMAASRRPSLDGSGRVLIFSSRHPIDEDDMNNDDDLYIRIRGGE